jgi:hypothetical protein
MRALVSILFSLALVLQGTDYARASHPPCPMEHSGDKATTIDKTAADVDCDCCDDGAATPGKLCNLGDCQATSPCLLVAGTSASSPVAAFEPPGFVEQLEPFDTPSSVWRPPALI